MTKTKTQEISVREFRQNLSLYLRAAKVKKIHFVVMNHTEPMAKFGPPDEKKKTRKQLREEFLRDIRKAQAQMDRGEYLTTEELRYQLGLPPSPFSGIQKGKRH